MTKLRIGIVILFILIGVGCAFLDSTMITALWIFLIAAAVFAWPLYGLIIAVMVCTRKR